MKYKDYYEILGVSRDASDADIKKAYRSLAHKYHPDVSKEPEAEARFKEIAEAYATLKDPEKKAAYDQLGRHAPGEDFVPPRGWSGMHGGGFDDFVDLSDLFAGFGMGGGAGAGGGRRWQPRPRKGENFEFELPYTIEDAYNTAEKSFSVQVPEVNAQGMTHYVPKTFNLRIPKGAHDGQKLRMAGRGGPGANGGPAGDLLVHLKLQPHPVFKPESERSANLHMNLPLAPWEAVLGATVEVPTPAGSVTLKVPAETRAGAKMRLKGRGLPRTDGTQGDLFAITRIEVPKQVDDKQKALYEQLRDASDFNPRSGLK